MQTNIFDDNIKYYKTFQKNIIDDNKEVIEEKIKNAFSMENFYFKDIIKDNKNNFDINNQIFINKNGENNNFNNHEYLENIVINKVINENNKIINNKSEYFNNNINNININNKTNILNNNNINLTGNINNIHSSNNYMNDSNYSLNSKLIDDILLVKKNKKKKNNKLTKLQRKEIKNKSNNIFSDKYDLYLSNKRKYSLYLNKNDLLKKIKEKNNISLIEINNSNLNKTYPIIIKTTEDDKEKNYKENIITENRPYIELRRDSINKNLYECNKKFKKRKSVDYIYIVNENYFIGTIIEKNLNKMKFKRLKTFGLDSQTNLNLVIKINEKSRKIINNSPNKKVKKLKSKKKNKKRKKGTKKNNKEKEEENNSNIIENTDRTYENKNGKNNLQRNIIKEKNSYLFNKELDFLDSPKKSKEQIEKEKEIQAKHKSEIFNYLMRNNINNLVKKKEKKNRFFNNKKIRFKFKNEKERETPPSLERRKSMQVLNSEKYISRLLKKQLIFDNSYLFQNEEKPKIYKNYNDIITLIPEEEKKNIIIQEVKDQQKQNNKNKSNNISKTAKNKVEEEINKCEETFPIISSPKRNKFKRKTKSKFSTRKELLNIFRNNDDDNKKGLQDEETEKEKKERLLMEKLYNFFDKIQKMKKSEDQNEVNEFINEEIEKKGINERRQRFLRLNSFIDDINYLRNLDKLIKPKIKYLSPLCFSYPHSSYNNNCS